MIGALTRTGRIASRRHGGHVRWWAWAFSLGFVACGSNSSSQEPSPTNPLTDGGTARDAAAVDVAPPDLTDAQTPPDDLGTESCHPEESAHAIEGAGHVATCTKIVYRTNPPSSGDHYGVWAAYKTYTQPIPVGFWVHDLEHGAVVITYNCPEGCAAEVAAAQAVIDAAPADCGAGQKRIILVPYPDLDVRFAASAWGYTLRASCFDRAAFANFITAHYGHGSEDICGGGEDPTGGPGGTPICAAQ